MTDGDRFKLINFAVRMTEKKVRLNLDATMKVAWNNAQVFEWLEEWAEFDFGSGYVMEELISQTVKEELG